MLHEKDIPENLPPGIISQLNLCSRFEAYNKIHFPQNAADFEFAIKRLKFEELYLAQLRLAMIRLERHRFSHGVKFDHVGDLFNVFYKQHLPFN